MDENISRLDAQLALSAVQDQRDGVVAEVGIPSWYWWALAAGWVALGAVNDLAGPWLAAAATLAFGAAHSIVAQRVLSGRHRTSGLSVRHGLGDPLLPLLVVAALVVLVGVTIALALAAHADGAEHPSIVASIPVAVAILGGGPRLVTAVRSRASSRTA